MYVLLSDFGRCDFETGGWSAREHFLWYGGGKFYKQN